MRKQNSEFILTHVKLEKNGEENPIKSITWSTKKKEDSLSFWMPKNSSKNI